MNPQESNKSDSDLEYPFRLDPIPVAVGLEGLTSFMENYPDFNFCPYLADKTASEWAISTSRKYMNQILPNFLYVPVNISATDQEELAQCVSFADENASIAAVNITKPHKSAGVLKQYFFDDAESSRNVDTLIKSSSDTRLHPFDLNAPAFINWFEDEAGSFEGKEIVIIGAGGVGEPLAKYLSRKNPASIHLVDVKDRSDLPESLSGSDYNRHLSDINIDSEDLIVINSSGKDGISDDTGILEFISMCPKGIFVDLRPQLEIDIVNFAKERGWVAYTGNGMNARNDYELLVGIMDYLNVPDSDRPNFASFNALVAAAS